MKNIVLSDEEYQRLTIIVAGHIDLNLTPKINNINLSEAVREETLKTKMQDQEILQKLLDAKEVN